MKRNLLKNPYFELGWNDWEITLSDATGRFSTVDGMRCGLMSDKPNPVGFPTVGNNYMLLARKAESSNDAAAASTIILETSSTYTLNPNDLIACDVGFVLTQKDGGTVLDEFGTFLKLQFGSSTPAPLQRWFYITQNTAVNQPGRFTLMGMSNYSTAQTHEISLTLSFDDLTSGTGSQFIEWISVDNFRVYRSIDYIDYAGAYDDSGVS